MYKIVSKLLMYGDMPKDSILMQLSDIFKQMDQDTQSRDELVTRIFTLPFVDTTSAAVTALSATS